MVPSAQPVYEEAPTPDLTYRGPSKVKFDPAIHLHYTAPDTIYTFSDLGVENNGTSPMAVTEPFQLATEDAVIELRRELLQESTLKNRLHWWHRAPAVLRGFTKEEAPFTHAFWTSPELIRLVERLAGIELEISLPYEIGHTNVQLGHGGRDALKDLKLRPEPTPYGWEEKKGDYDDVPVDSWHLDSFPYSVVMMLSNTEKMSGGETAVQLCDGSVKKVRGTGMGSATFIQGRHLWHAALRAQNTGERITMVCPYRAKHPTLRDDTEITNSLQISYRNELLGQFALERFRVLSKKSNYMIERLVQQKEEALAREPTNYDAVIMDKKEVEDMIREMIRYLGIALQQMGLNGETI